MTIHIHKVKYFEPYDSRALIIFHTTPYQYILPYYYANQPLLILFILYQRATLLLLYALLFKAVIEYVITYYY